jgi:hypothetical protein
MVARVVPELTLQLALVERICRILVAGRVTSLDAVEREDLESLIQATATASGLTIDSLLSTPAAGIIARVVGGIEALEAQDPTASSAPGTQSFLKRLGIKEVTLYRGIGSSDTAVQKGSEIEVAANPLSSWTTDKGTAKFFADGATRWADSNGGRKVDGLVIEMTVPASAIQSVPSTGRGCLMEFEAVLNGLSGTATILDVVSADDTVIK